jgi:hypothetical protein
LLHNSKQPADFGLMAWIVRPGAGYIGVSRIRGYAYIRGYGYMHHKLMRTTARTAVIGAVIVLGSTAAAQGAPARPAHAGTVSVPCNTPALISAISGASSGEKLRLAARCTYALTAALPEIHTSLTIAGSGASLERSEADGTPDFTILTVGAGDVNLVRVNFRNGGGNYYDNAGAIENKGGNITVLDGTFADNNTSDEGDGAIYNDSGNLTITSVYFTLNDAEAGGAITNNATLTLRSSRFFDNSANMGGAIYNTGTAAVIGTTFTENDAFEGGALSNTGHAALSSVTIKNNSAEAAVGGGIYNDGTLTTAASNIVHNTARYGGGGIYNGASVALSLTKVSGNTPDNCEPVGTIAGCSG